MKELTEAQLYFIVREFSNEKLNYLFRPGYYTPHNVVRELEALGYMVQDYSGYNRGWYRFTTKASKLISRMNKLYGYY